MKNVLLLSASLFLASIATAQLPNTWTQKTSLPANSRATAFAFSIGNKGYVGGGLNFSVGVFNDFWEYNPASNSWTQKANLGGGPRSAAVGFSIGAKGYALTGSDGTGKKNDIWEYDTLLNAWTQKTSLPGIARNYAVAFSIGNKGYIGTGYTDSSFISLSDFWQFDPVANSWVRKADVPFPQRSSAVGFAINGKGYIGTGDTCNSNTCFALNDFYAYDTLTNTWSVMANAGASLRNDAVAFVINGKGYICTGEVNFTNSNDLIEYDPLANIWSTRASIPGPGRTNAFAFAIENHAYVGTGYDPSFNTMTSMYEYTPDSIVATSVHDISNPASVSVLQNPFSEFITVNIHKVNFKAVAIKIFNALGKTVYIGQENYNAGESTRTINLEFLSPGIYFMEVTVDSDQTVKRIVKE